MFHSKGGTIVLLYGLHENFCCIKCSGSANACVCALSHGHVSMCESVSTECFAAGAGAAGDDCRGRAADVNPLLRWKRMPRYCVRV